MGRIVIAALVAASMCGSAFALSVGDRAPDISATKWINADQEISLDGLKGKVAVVEFWATWCPPCIKSIPHLSKLQRKYADEVVVIGLTYESPATVKPFAERMDMDFIVGAGSTSGRKYGVNGIPHAVVVGHDGIVVWEGHPLNGLDEAVARAVAAKAAAVEPPVQLAAL